jgi:hypothetical protein
MLCYKDKAFCPFHTECNNGKNCEAALTEQIKIDAVKWWGNEDAPIFILTTKPNCFCIKNY